MNELEEIFNESAKDNMIDWDLESFRNTHPKLLKSILESMEKCKDFNCPEYFDFTEGLLDSETE